MDSRIPLLPDGELVSPHFEPVVTETKDEKAMQVECSVCNLLESFQALSPSLPFSLREVREVT